jgi:hypothetical protein
MQLLPSSSLFTLAYVLKKERRVGMQLWKIVDADDGGYKEKKGGR